jgi:hypothetical protein
VAVAVDVDDVGLAGKSALGDSRAREERPEALLEILRRPGIGRRRLDDPREHEIARGDRPGYERRI